MQILFKVEDLQQVTLAYGYYVRPHAFDKAVWSTAGQCGLSVRPRDTTSCTESGKRTRTTDLQIGESPLKPTAPTGPTIICAMSTFSGPNSLNYSRQGARLLIFNFTYI